MTQRTAEPTLPDDDDDSRDRDRVDLVDPADSPAARTRTAKADPEPPYLPGYYLG